jgi:hypothetical protein
MWSIVGVHDMGWTERPIFGKIRWMNHAGLLRKHKRAGLDAYVARSKADAKAEGFPKPAKKESKAKAAFFQPAAKKAKKEEKAELTDAQLQQLKTTLSAPALTIAGVKSALSDLERSSMSLKSLRASKIGASVNALRKNAVVTALADAERGEIEARVRRLIATWKLLVPAKE